MLGALTKPTEGKLLLDGTDVWTLSEAELATFRSRRIGFIFQFPSLLSNLTAVDNVAVPALLGRTMDAGQAYARAYDLLARVGLRGPRRCVSRQHVRRRAAPRRHCPCAHQFAAAAARRRADQRSRRRHRDRHHRSARAAAADGVVRLRPRHPQPGTGQARAADLRNAPGRTRGHRPAAGSRSIRNAHGTSDQPRSTRRRTSRCPRRGGSRPSASAPACGAASRSSCWQEPSSSAASCWPISGSTNIRRCGFGSATRGSPPCSIWRSTACAATSSRSPISATGATN